MKRKDKQNKKVLKTKRLISIEGLLKGVKVTEEDIEEAKKSLFKEGKI